MGTLVIIVAVLAKFSITVAQSDSWYHQRDNLSEYQLIATKSAVRSDAECLAIAGGMMAPAVAHAASYYEAAGICTMFQCTLGSSGCRKCRNAQNSSMPTIWVRVLSNPTNCWTTFQHRVDGSLSFNRSWADYVAGFGQGEDLNYWMGLEQLYSILNAGNCATSAACRARWEFSDWNNTWYWAENTAFSVASASDKYRLTMGALDTSRSNIGQIPLNHGFSPNNMRFSTFDSDSDSCPDCNCAAIMASGWWHNWCAAINPNGICYSLPAAISGSQGGRMYYFYDGSSNPLSLGYSLRSFEILLLIAK